MLRHAAILALLASPATAAAADLTPPTDATLAALLSDSLAARPELRAVEARARADKERVEQAEALPDPVVSLGIQNDTFTGIEVGRAETSFVSIAAAQSFPWPGKRDLRGEVAALGAEASATLVGRVRLATEAEVRRGYLDLVVVRQRLALLEELATLWQRSAEQARARYEVGAAPQADILRAQLEQTRLRQRKIALEAEERIRLAALNRLRNHPPDDAIAGATTLADDAPPVVLPLADEIADAEGRSPELRAARVAVRQAGRQGDLARKEQYPDLGVSAGVMLRFPMEPMWQVGVSMNLPFLWGRGRRTSAIREADLRGAGEREAAEGLAQILRERVAERHAALEALLATARLYREGLLVQSRTTVDSTLAQYRVGKLSFASVLEALAGYVSDQEAYLMTLADLERVAIARAEVSLEPVAFAGVAGAATSMPGAGAATRAGPAAAPAAAAPEPAAAMQSGM